MAYGDGLVVKLKKNTSQSAFNNLLTLTHCSIVKKYPFANDTYIVSAGLNNNYDPVVIANRFFETGLFEYAEPDLTLLDGLFSDPNDPLYSYQWAHTNTGSAIQYNGLPGADMSVQQAWGISTGAGIKVAVIDEGVDIAHADLSANMLQGYDCISGTANPGDGQPLGPARAHGTNCTGIIAAVANNNIGIAGVAPDSKIIPINLAAANGNFTTEANIAAGFDYAWQHGADVISNSWGGGTPSSIIDDAISRAVTLGRGGKGSVVLFASGNNNSGIGYPASNPNVISVGGVNMCGRRKSPASSVCDGEYWGASYGTGLDVVAPCVKIVSTDISGTGGYNTAAGAAGDYYFTFNGTSSATPSAAGVVALILAANNSLTVGQVRSILENTCDKLPGYSYANVAAQPNGTWNDETGHGRVNAFNAVQVALSGMYCNVQIEANGATRFCAGGNVNLAVINPIGGNNYQWRKDGINFTTGTSVTASISGSYDVVATATNGCAATSAPIIVTALTNTPALTASAGIDTFICAGNSVKLGGNPVAAGGAPVLADKRVYGMDWMSNSFVKFSLQDPLHFDTIAQNLVPDPEFIAGQFFSGGDFTPYGYYAITQGTNKLVKVDTTTGTTQLIGIAAAPSGYDWSGLAWDPSTKNLYGLATTNSGSSLCIIDLFTAAVTQVALVPVGLTEWVAINNNGSMYTMSDNNYVYSINKFTGAASALPNPVGADVIYQQDADFDPVTNNLYLTTIIQYQNYASDFRTVDTVTGISSIIGSLGGLSEIDATGIAGPGYQYNWSPSAGLNSTTVSVPVATPLITTTYTLNVTDMCGNTASSQVVVHVNTPPPVALTAPTDSICAGETVRLSATKDNSYTYQWYRNGNIITGSTDSFYVAGAGGSYTVKAMTITCDSLSLPFVVKTCQLRMNSNNPATVCNTYFYDSGGLDSNYADDESFTRTVTALTPSSVPQVIFNSFSTGAGNDVLTIYDGPTISSPVLASLSGHPSVPLTYTGTSNTLTFQYTSNGSVTDSGWAGTISCYQPNVYRSRASGNADNVNTWEVKSGGSFINAVDFPHVYDDSIIIQPGHTVSINTATQLDQVWVQAGAVLQVDAPFNLHDGTGSDLLVDGSLLIGAAGNITGNGILTLNGTLDNTASANSNVFVRTEIGAGAAQTIAAGGSFGTLYISNPLVVINLANGLSADSIVISNGTGTVTITADNPSTLLTINKKLSLQNGRLIMGNNATLDLAVGSMTEGGNASSFVEGPVRNSTNTAGLSTLFFPVGKDVYRPVSLDVTHSSAGLSVYQAEVFNTAAATRTMPSTINAVSSTRHFKISNIGSQPLTAAAATLTYGLDDGVTDASSLRMAKDDGTTNWIDLGGTGTANGMGTITSTVNFTSFSDFVLANALNGANALPVKWLEVAAKMAGKQVQVTWKTANEINVENYVAERSADGISFDGVARVHASNSPAAEKQYQITDVLPLKGNNYYRILQTDKDGKYSYSKTVLVNVSETGNFLLWPNPATDAVTVQNSQAIIRLQCYNGNGQLMYDVKPAANQYTIPLQQWAAGIYHVKITSAGKVFQATFVKK
ncbi:MAG: S8 family serine peptidase [Bacteroidota bacterium]